MEQPQHVYVTEQSNIGHPSGDGQLTLMTDQSFTGEQVATSNAGEPAGNINDNVIDSSVDLGDSYQYFFDDDDLAKESLASECVIGISGEEVVSENLNTAPASFANEELDVNGTYAAARPDEGDTSETHWSPEVTGDGVQYEEEIRVQGEVDVQPDNGAIEVPEETLDSHTVNESETIEEPICEDEVKNTGTTSEALDSEAPVPEENEAPLEATKKSSRTSNVKNKQDGKEEAAKKARVVQAELNVNSRPKRSTPRRSVFEMLQGEIRSPPNASKRFSSEPDSESETDTAHSKKITGTKRQAKPVGETSKLDSKRSKKTPNAKNQNCDNDDMLELFSDDPFPSSDEPKKKRGRPTGKKAHTDIGAEENDDNYIVNMHAHDDDGFDDSDDEIIISKMPRKLFTRDRSIEKKKDDTLKYIFSDKPNGGEAQNSHKLDSVEASTAHDSLWLTDAVNNSHTDITSKTDEPSQHKVKPKETEGKSGGKKFDINFQRRKFSRIRPSTKMSGHVRKSGTPSAKADRDAQSTELSIAEKDLFQKEAMLKRQEEKLRELDSELDERAAMLKVQEGSLWRKDRRLKELEKTLEYRERLLHRHEQSAQKKESDVEGGQGESSSVPKESGADDTSSTLTMSFEARKLEVRRQELDRRQEKLVAREHRIEIKEEQLKRKELRLQNAGAQESEQAETTVAETRKEKTMVKKVRSLKDTSHKMSIAKKVKASIKTAVRLNKKNSSVATSRSKKLLSTAVTTARKRKSDGAQKQKEYKLRKR